MFPGGGSAAGFGNGAVQNGAAIGTGTGIANPGQGIFPCDENSADFRN